MIAPTTVSNPAPPAPRRGGAVAVLVVLIVGLLTGCSGAGRPDTAAVVGGKAISAEDLRLATQQLSENVNPQVTEKFVLSMLILNELATEPAAAAGLWRPDAEFNAVLLKVPQPAPATVAALSGLYASTAMNEAGLNGQLIQRARTLGVSVNPRYGSFDASTAGLGNPLPNWIRPSGPGSAPAA